MTDEKIMNEVKNGKIQQLAILFEKHHIKVYNYFFHLTRKKNISEDLTQEVFLRILKYKKSYKPEGKFTSWMYQIGRNIFIDYTRKNKEEVLVENIENLNTGIEPLPEEIEGGIQEQELLYKALSILPPSKREILILSRFQGMKYKDISVLLKCSIPSVKTQVYRATKQLKTIYINIKEGGGFCETERLQPDSN